MQKISDSTTTANPAGEFTEGNPGAGVDSTLLKAQWLNAIQREIIAFIVGAGITVDKTDDAQMLKAVKAFMAKAFTKDEANLRFVRMGGGIGQLGNQIYVGWSGTKLKATVDGLDLGGIWSESTFDPSKKADLAQVDARIAALVGSVPATLDTLQELADALGRDPNFAATMTSRLASKLPSVGGDYRPRLSNLTVGAGLTTYSVEGGHIGWGNGESELGGSMQFVCNRGLGVGGFSFRSVNQNNTDTGPIMTYSYDGLLKVPRAINTPSIIGNTTVPTQPATDNSDFIASTAHVKLAIAAMVAGAPATLDTLRELADALGRDPNFATTMTAALASKPLRDGITTLGFASNNVLFPYMRRESDAQVYYLQPALGFTPVQQGGGTGLGGNKLRLGWGSGGLRLQVDESDIGVLWGQSNFCRPDAQNFLGVAVAGTSVQLPAGGTWCYSLMHYFSDGRGVTGASGQAAGGTVISFSGGATIYGFAWRYTP